MCKFCRKKQGRKDVPLCQGGKVLHNLRDRHARPEIFKDIGDSDTGAPDTRLTAPDAFVKGEMLPKIHAHSFGHLIGFVN